MNNEPTDTVKTVFDALLTNSHDTVHFYGNILAFHVGAMQYEIRLAPGNVVRYSPKDHTLTTANGDESFGWSLWSRHE